MKPLELTIYPLREKVGRNARPGYIVGTRAVSTSEAHRMGTAKRLTDPELAAILWFTVSREAHAEAMGWRTGHAQDWINTNKEECRIVGILERLASLPHAADKDYQ